MIHMTTHAKKNHDQPLAGAIPEFGTPDRVRKAREFRDMTQTELAEQTEIARATIARIEQGKSNPRRPTLISIALATGVDFHWLETGKTPTGDNPDGGGAVGHQGLEPRTR